MAGTTGDSATSHVVDFADGRPVRARAWIHIRDGDVHREVLMLSGTFGPTGAVETRQRPSRGSEEALLALKDYSVAVVRAFCAGGAATPEAVRLISEHRKKVDLPWSSMGLD